MTDCNDFTCGKVDVGVAYDASRHCRMCFGAATVPALAKRLGRSILFQWPPPPAKALPVIAPCLHEGAIVEKCPSCAGNSALAESRHRRKCNHPTKGGRICTRTWVDGLPYDQEQKSLVACDSCDDRPEPSGPPVGKRHLVYHLLPVAGNGVWQDAVNQLRLRWGLFTGRKIISIATGRKLSLQYDGQTATLDSVATVRKYLPPDAEVIEVVNDANQWERVSWSLLWRKVLEGADPDDVILYAHAKGVTRPTIITTEDYKGTPQHWARLCYTLALDYWDEIEAQFRKGFPLVGPLLKKQAGFAGGIAESKWHYSGNFWWGRAGVMRDALAKHPMPVDKWATEAWPGIVFPMEQAGEIGPQLHGSEMYIARYWNYVVVPAVAKWQAEHVPSVPTKSLRPMSITWVSAATRGYEADLARLQASCDKFGAGHRFIFHRLDSADKFHLTVKFDLLRQELTRAETSHVFWVDADCEFLKAIPVADLIDPAKPLTAVRHFGSNGAKEYLPDHLARRVTWPLPGDLSWQSCLFGGTVEALAAQMERLKWMDQEGVTYEEWGIVMDWSERPEEVLTLPCRYATPSTFAPWPQYESTYNARSGGPPIVIHHNRASMPTSSSTPSAPH